MPDLYIIMGESNMKKSSVIRCLTGVSTENVYKILNNNDQVEDTYVKVYSLQEAGLTPADFVSRLCSNTKYNSTKNILIGLRIQACQANKLSTIYPRGEAYINYYNNIRGWNICKVVDFQISPSSHLNIGSIPIASHTIYATHQTPANEVAKTVRGYFGWV